MTVLEHNQASLNRALVALRERIENKNTAAREAPEPPQLTQLGNTFRLTEFERYILLMCAGVELDATFASACATAQGDASLPFPTFDLALSSFEGAHWSALNPAAPLRYWRLIEVAYPGPAPLTKSRLRIDERILHFLAGVQYLDERLNGVVQFVDPVRDLPASQSRLVAEAAQAVQATGSPVIQLRGSGEGIRQAVASAACRIAGLHLYSLSADQIPFSGAEITPLFRLWEREAVLLPSALYINADSVDRSESRSASLLTRALEPLRCPVIVGVRDQWLELQRPVRVFTIPKPEADEQGALWNDLLTRAGVSINGHASRLADQFNLAPASIQMSVQEAIASGAQGDELVTALWDASRAQSRPRLNELAHNLEPTATWDDLVLPAPEKAMLRSICTHVRYRAQVYSAWGFGEAKRGLGISTLFAGASGTGKTMAAEVLANELRLDLYRIDLSSVVSKYIGETEKNLRRVFEAAEAGGAILFFDEADALFGKRSEVKDSHDRYANIEINYLLQRMESFAGLAVLATNMRSALDTAFLRRIRFVVNFPLPEPQQRAEIWGRVFPAATPTENLEITRLARLALSGGSIRNIAMNAAFMAAADHTPVRMSHMAKAAREEFLKLERPLPEAEIGDWQ